MSKLYKCFVHICCIILFQKITTKILVHVQYMCNCFSNSFDPWLVQSQGLGGHGIWRLTHLGSHAFTVAGKEPTGWHITEGNCCPTLLLLTNRHAGWGGLWFVSHCSTTPSFLPRQCSEALSDRSWSLNGVAMGDKGWKASTWHDDPMKLDYVFLRLPGERC